MKKNINYHINESDVPNNFLFIWVRTFLYITNFIIGIIRNITKPKTNTNQIILYLF